MTDRERLCAGLVLSCFLHWGAAQLALGLVQQNGEGTEYLAQIDMDSLALAPMDGQTGSIGMEAPPPGYVEQSRAADRRRRAFFDYLDAVEAAVHARRLDGGEENLIGVATFAFVSFADGTFSPPTLRQSSGSAPLDAAARRAIAAASGVVRRPALLGTGDIPILLQVKYQYGLR